jgi:hypothetical protein
MQVFHDDHVLKMMTTFGRSDVIDGLTIKLSCSYILLSLSTMCFSIVVIALAADQIIMMNESNV